MVVLDSSSVLNFSCWAISSKCPSVRPSVRPSVPNFKSQNRFLCYWVGFSHISWKCFEFFSESAFLGCFGALLDQKLPFSGHRRTGLQKRWLVGFCFSWVYGFILSISPVLFFIFSKKCIFGPRGALENSKNSQNHRFRAIVVRGCRRDGWSDFAFPGFMASF